RLKYFLGLHIEETQAHRAMPHDPFEVTDSTAAAVTFLRVQRYNHMARFPDAVGVRIPSEADAVAQVPDTHRAIHRVARGGNACREGIGIVDRAPPDVDTILFQTRTQRFGDVQALQLTQIRGFLDHAAAD